MTQNKLFRSCTIAACAVIVANGCVFPRNSLPAVNNYKVQPGQFCPGDTVRASFDFLGTEICRDMGTVTCEMLRPDMRITSAPESFPPALIHDYLGQVDFVPAGDRVDVTFDIDRNPVSFPSVRTDGTSYLASRPASDQTLAATRITGTVESTLIHNGLCAGSTPAHAPASLSSPNLSPNLRVRELCNVNSVPVSVTLSGSAPGTTFNQMLAPGQCLNTGMPGVPSGIDASTMVEVRSLTIDPSARCGVPTQADNPPAPLRTIVRRSCG